MKRLSLETQKALELEILLYIDKICRGNQIEYSICGGTMLGAVRHRGFIPWDDDIDIFLIRPEYERLKEILKKDTSYRLISEEAEGYYYTFSKLVNQDTVLKSTCIGDYTIPDLGVFVDIFPIDGVPEQDTEQEEFVEELNGTQERMRTALKDSYYISDRYWKAAVKKILYYPRHRKALKQGMPRQQKEKLLEKVRQYSFEQSRYAGFVLSAYKSKEIMPSEVFQGTMDMEFEGHKVRCLKQYDIWLSNMFGNYMELPPEKDRISHHPYVAYWKDENHA